MVKLIVGLKGSGKTKTLIDLVNARAAESKGSVICIEKGNKLNIDITHKARLIDTDSFMVADAQALYGFVAGISASNHDITDIFIDSILKIAPEAKIEGFVSFVEALAPTLEKNGINLVMTASTEVEHIPEPLKKYL